MLPRKDRKTTKVALLSYYGTAANETKPTREAQCKAGQPRMTETTDAAEGEERREVGEGCEPAVSVCGME